MSCVEQSGRNLRWLTVVSLVIVMVARKKRT